jgi:hypothetical protein
MFVYSDKLSKLNISIPLVSLFNFRDQTPLFLCGVCSLANVFKLGTALKTSQKPALHDNDNNN